MFNIFIIVTILVTFVNFDKVMQKEQTNYETTKTSGTLG